MKNRIAGALALSALGDALGLPNEARGLRGEVSEWPGEGDKLWPLPVAESYRGSEANPWNVWAPPDVTAGMRGVVSDDTAIKAALTEPWLRDAQQHGHPIDETGFVAWLRRRPAETVAWREAMAAEQARQWLGMFDAAQRGESPCVDDGSPCFYITGEPACFGPFLYLEAALLDAGRPVTAVFDRFAEMCRLDQGDGPAVTGVLAAALAAAAAGEAAEYPFDLWWFALLTELHEQERLSRPLFHRLFWCVRTFGHHTRTLPPGKFLQRMKSELYDDPHRGATHGLKPFDPVLQLSQLLGCIGYAGDDTLLALKLAAFGPGDTDTLAAMLGLIAGARAGHTALSDSSVGTALQTVEESVTQLFDRTLHDRVETFLPGFPVEVA